MEPNDMEPNDMEPNDMEPDRLSWLPGHVIDRILSYLPIEDAVRTSVLSSMWKKKWHTLPSIVFNTDCVSFAPFQNHSISNIKFLKMVDNVLLLHSGPINKFKIRNYNTKLICAIPETDIDRWILHLIERSIQKLVLQISLEEQYKIPWGLFSCQSLRDLRLYDCCLTLPTMFEGLKNLKKLDLYDVTISQDDLESLISRCPLLENLMLTEVDISQINIHAPNLKYFSIFDEFEDISFDDTFQLTEVYVGLSLYLNSESNQSRLHGRSSNLLKIFNGLPHIWSLAIHDYFLKYLSVGVVPTKLPTPCIELECLSLCINFDDLKEISTAICLLRSSPNLQTLYISATMEEQNVLLTPAFYYWEDIFSKPAMLLRVQHVTINFISGFKSETNLIKFLLLYSPRLEKMIVNPLVKVRQEVELLRELLQFKRASAKAQVIYMDEDSL
ncbi:F-box/FBD/LRR-repeat protein At1g13570-like [Vicia villosa]|uniref:F-box/FBD/LRR-repeat protein At1g13570-like n=1 Tax=Vicia villosa TaxID=3911 RepID=UPI00273B57DE|nr:F-box/FBD/LRR-repeat protein At1g13570-like [Vicia villosa]